MSINAQPLSAQETQNLQVKLNRNALRFGLLATVVIFLYNLFINTLGNGDREATHFLIYGILLLMLAYAFNRTKSLFPEENATNSRIVFGLKMSAVAALGTIALNLLALAIDYQLEVSEINQPIDSVFKLAVNSMGTILGFLSFGFLSSFILAFYYEKR